MHPLVHKVYTLTRRILPNSAVKSARNLLEARLDGVFKQHYYGQFAEDAVIRDILRKRHWDRHGSSDGITDMGCGFYVDVGAYAPKQYSNTYLFYKHGWRGINIDATPGSMRQFERVRPRDINLELAISSSEGEMTFYSWGSPNVFNTFSVEHARSFEEKIGTPPQKIPVQALKLATVLDRHVPAGQSIDLMSVDAEGHDLEVLKSNDWERFRPGLLIVEVHHDTVDEVLDTEVVKYLRARNYNVHTVVGPSVIFERRD